MAGVPSPLKKPKRTRSRVGSDTIKRMSSKPEERTFNIAKMSSRGSPRGGRATVDEQTAQQKRAAMLARW